MMHKCSVSHLFIMLWRSVKNRVTYFFIALALFGPQAVLAQTDLVEKPSAQSQMNQSTSPLAITLIEKGDKLVLYANGRCSLNNLEEASLNEETNPWQSIVNKDYLDSLSGLAILEQVKEQVKQSRVVIAINTDAETKLTIHSSGYTKNIALYSVDLMHSTYPKAQLLSQFMEVIELMREAKPACSN